MATISALQWNGDMGEAKTMATSSEIYLLIRARMLLDELAHRYGQDYAIVTEIDDYFARSNPREMVSNYYHAAPKCYSNNGENAKRPDGKGWAKIAAHAIFRVALDDAEDMNEYD